MSSIRQISLSSLALIALIVMGGAHLFINAPATAAETNKGQISSIDNNLFAENWTPLFTELQDKNKEHFISPDLITDVFCPQIKIFYPKGWQKTDNRPLLCVFPGGGYSIESLAQEGAHVAQWANTLGMVAAVVKYRVSQQNYEIGQFPGPLLDTRRALRTCRKNAKSLGINPNKIGIIGFSAGGHLAAMTATLWGKKLNEEKNDPFLTISARPDFALLIYPVITMQDQLTHSGTQLRILGKTPTPELKELCSTEKQVTSATPPIFLAQSQKDTVVSCKNSEIMEQACKAHQVDVKLILYTEGEHGRGIEKQNKPLDAWPQDAAKWLQSHQFTYPSQQTQNPSLK